MIPRIVLLLLILSAHASAQSAVEPLVEQNIAALLETYRYLHSHPELSYFEKETAALVAKELRALGFDVTENVGNYNVPGRTSYGVVAVMRNGAGPTVLVRTDLDALPVEENTGAAYASNLRTKDETGVEVSVMHACGHDVHMTSFIGTARILSRLKDQWRGTLVMIGQPAEERGAGARAMLADGLFTKFPRPNYAIALHTDASLEAGKVGYVPGYALANVDSVDITIRGKGGHGAYPHTTIDPIVIAAHVVEGLQTIVSREVSPLDSAVITVGSIHGGTKHNVIPDAVYLQLTVRSYKSEVRSHLLDAIRRVTNGVAASAGVPRELAPVVRVAEDEFTPSTYNDPELTERLARIFEKTFGQANTVRREPVMGGEDFGRFGSTDPRVPSVLFWLGVVDPQKMSGPLPSLHSSEYLPLAEPAIRTGVRAMSAAVLDLMKP